VESQEQSERETCRVIVFDPDRKQVLVVGDEAGLVFLPSVEIPRWERLAENLTLVVKSEWGCDAISLFDPDPVAPEIRSGRLRYEAMECRCGGESHSGNAAWRSIRTLTRNGFRDGEDYRALERCLRELDFFAEDPASPFAKSGWFTELRSWIAAAIAPGGVELIGPFCQLNASPSFSLIRLETSGPAMWFKAVGEPNRREFPITLKLAQSFPKYLPAILGVRPDWNGWLSAEAAGTNLVETREITCWERAATALAKLQIESMGQGEAILDSGTRDLRADLLSASVDPFLDNIAQIMEGQTKVPPPILSREELDLLAVRIQDSLTLLSELGISDALGHLDLNPGNLIVSADGCLFLDWAEAYWGHPFFTFEYLLEHFRSTVGANVVDEARLARSYIAPWEHLFPADLLHEALALAPLAAAFAYAAGADGWRDSKRLQDPKAVGYFRSLARRMNREAIQFTDRRLPCLN